MSAPIVVASNLTRVFDVSKPWLSRVIAREPRRLITAVDDVSFEIERGKSFALVGESGSGKSTVARMVVGLLPPTHGQVLIQGVSMVDPEAATQRKMLRRRIQMIFQDPYASLNPRWRVDRIIAEPIRAFRLLDNVADIQARTAELLQQVGLHPDDGQKFPHQFSGGQRQRIAIARAIASGPEFLVCDEPTSALDVSVQSQILNLMRDLQDQLGLTYLFISHNLAVVRYMAARVGVIRSGKLVEVGPVQQIFTAPAHAYTRMLIAAVPDVGAAKTRGAGHDTLPDAVSSRA